MNELTLLDYIALAYFFSLILGYGWLSNKGPLKGKNISVGVHRQREKWINTMLERENRIFDSQILISLSQGNAFFASTAMVITGALATSLGSASEIAAMLEQFPIPALNTPQLVKLKITFIMIIFIKAFFSFAWAFRLTHYTCIMIGAMPHSTSEYTEDTKDHVSRTVEISGLSGKHSNSGLHTYYYGIAAAGWLINAMVFILATSLIIFILYRREFLSNSHDLLNPPCGKKSSE